MRVNPDFNSFFVLVLYIIPVFLLKNTLFCADAKSGFPLTLFQEQII